MLNQAHAKKVLQRLLFEYRRLAPPNEKPVHKDIIDYNDYDKILVQMSGGKDSVACLLHLFELGIDKSKIEIWHQCIDGKNDTHKAFFDWKSTEGYVRALARHFGLPLLWVWREYGMWGEMHRENARTGAVRYQYDGEQEHVLLTKGGQESTRLKFPAKSPDLSTRWCSAYLKITPAARVIKNLPALQGSKEKPMRVLMVTGERREESANRAKYEQLERFETKERVFHQYRAVIDWTELEVWEIMCRHGILPHPAYYLGFPRLSCKSCIFFSPNHWATLYEIDKQAIDTIARLERDFQHTLDNKKSIYELVRAGESLINDSNRRYVKQALHDWETPIYTPHWTLPAGAFGKGGGAM